MMRLAPLRLGGVGALIALGACGPAQAPAPSGRAAKPEAGLTSEAGAPPASDAATAAPGASPNPADHAPAIARAQEAGAPALAPPKTLPDAPADPRELRWLVVAGGPEPSSNQVQIAQDTERAANLLGHLGAGGQVLFGGGPDSASVLAVAADTGDDARGDPLIRRLGELFAPRAGRNVRYQAPPFRPHERATTDRALEALTRALQAPTANPLLVLFAGHGDHADGPDDAGFATWGGGWLAPTDLAPLLDKATRPTRFVVATCFAGGWAPITYDHPGTCGVYATTWDRVASGCDPDPDRRAHEGYLVQLFAALDKVPAADAVTAFDRDGDGKVGLLDAHIAAAARSRGFEVPVASSSQYLLATAPQAGAEATAPLDPLPEETWLVAQLEARLADGGTPTTLSLAQIERRLAEFDSAFKDVTEAATEAGDRESDTLATARGEALGRWPVLDDPWHPDWVPTLATHKSDIAAWLQASPAYAAWSEAAEALDRANNAADAIDLARAPWLRLAIAQRTLSTARRVAALPANRQKPIWARFMALRTCERRPLP